MGRATSQYSLLALQVHTFITVAIILTLFLFPIQYNHIIIMYYIYWLSINYKLQIRHIFYILTYNLKYLVKNYYVGRHFVKMYAELHLLFW